jgi:hypothetical protein
MLLLPQAFLLATLCYGAPAPPKKPPKTVYHYYFLVVAGEKLTPEEMRKLLAPLDVAKSKCITSDRLAEHDAQSGTVSRLYTIYIRTEQPYERVLKDLKTKPRVQKVGEPGAGIKRTLDKIPVPKVTVGIPLNVPHYPNDPVHQKKP